MIRAWLRRMAEAWRELQPEQLPDGSWRIGDIVLVAPMTTTRHLAARQAVRDCDAARQFPAVTCPASRHAQMIGEQMVAGGFKGPCEAYDFQHMGTSILSTVESLWKARAEIKLLQDLVDTRDEA